MKIKIGEVDVEFPYEPYNIQKKYMEKLIEAIITKKNAMLESPTGTGKTLSSICAAMAWLKKEKENRKVPEDEEHFFYGHRPGDVVNMDKPRVYFCSRTHTQLSQVIKEVKNTSYNPSVAILASRTNIFRRLYCSSLKEITIKERRLERVSCKYKDNIEVFLKDNRRNKSVIRDIEELNELGSSQSICPYFYQRNQARNADLVLMPYNYLIDGSARASSNLSFEGSVIIIDEAHNIDSICENSASQEFTEETLDQMLSQIRSADKKINTLEAERPKKVSSIHSSTSQDRQDVIGLVQGLKNFIKSSWENKCWSMFKRVNDCTMIAQVGNIIEFLNTALQKHNSSTIKFEEEKDISGTKCIDEEPSLSTISRKNFYEWLNIIRGVTSDLHIHMYNKVELTNLFQIFDMTLSLLNNMQSSSTKAQKEKSKLFTSQFQLIATKEESKYDDIVWKTSVKLTFQCLSPEYVFTKLKSLRPRSIILTSGTLSPLDSLESELGLEFPVRLENKHVIYPDQIFLSTLSQGTAGNPFRFTYYTKDLHEMNEDLGLTIIEILYKSKNGSLIFFKSYEMMQAMLDLWTNKMQLFKPEGALRYHFKTTKLSLTDNEKHIIFIEPQKASEFGKIKAQFETKISKGENTTLMGVCKGKVSEGMDFSDTAARLVIVIGIPNAVWTDPKVQCKKRYLEEKRNFAVNISKDSSDNYLNGAQWYDQQAQRAVNQAIGRVIRHRKDYGAIILIDNRYSLYREHRSNWMSSLQKDYDSLETLLFEMNAFYKRMDKSDPKSSDYDEEEVKFRDIMYKSHSELREKIKNTTKTLSTCHATLKSFQKRPKVKSISIEEEFAKIETFYQEQKDST
ncbi:unnamed protein product [Moneuplotes crassus]|uniref:Helicase ATP-binding domain-containing protein n=1 Tax=Euplotes crassus TaxID=5936 RepID=A0AAD1Y484_EUPCR|nr:unnamed protein product [Moneuplotes crassus]